MDTLLVLLILLGIGLGLAAWIIHLYTLILSYFSDTRWKITVEFNAYHEAIPELALFSALIIYMLIILAMVFPYLRS